MYRKFVKRLLDLLIGIMAFPLFLLAFLIFAPIIFLTDRGPVFYNAERLGKNGKRFKMYKFRSMFVNAPDIRLKDGSTYNGENDPRVTKIGRVLRRTSIDELPQILNVINGTMSLIGPRPNLPPKEGETLSRLEQRRLEVKPGITGYNQAYFRNSVSAEERYVNDVYYVDHLSFGLDVRVFFRTIKCVLKKENINIQEEKKEIAG
ncbi:MAG: sugar transferase [Eubacteriales bacterium]|nr:sugar transferase [Eubacteriales bacterium]